MANDKSISATNLENLSKPAEPSSEWKPDPRSVHQLADPSAVALKGYRFSATMQPTTPLSYLRRHGEMADVIRVEEQGLDNKFYVWLPEVDIEFAFLSKRRTMYSSIGPIDPDGGDFLPFLMELRQIIERARPADVSDYYDALTKVEDIRALGSSSLANASDYLGRLYGDAHDSLLTFVLSEQGSLSFDGLTPTHLEELYASGFSSIAEMIDAPDATLLGLHGVGPGRLRKIRANKGNGEQE